MYLRARYYQPEKGRFLTRDMYTGEEDEPRSLHLYVYCGNDGVNAWDPSGHMFRYIEQWAFKDLMNEFVKLQANPKKKSYRIKLYSVSGHNCYLVSKKNSKIKDKNSSTWRRFAKKNGLFEYFTGNMDVDCDGSGKPEDYGYKSHTSYVNSTAVTYSNGKPLNAFETKYFVLHMTKHIGSENGTLSGKTSPGIVWDTKQNKKVYAVAGDAGPKDLTHIGEASAKVFKEFGYKFYEPKNSGNARWSGVGSEKGSRFRYIVSITSRIKIPEKNSNRIINKEGKKLFSILKEYGYDKAKSLKK